MPQQQQRRQQQQQQQQQQQHQLYWGKLKDAQWHPCIFPCGPLVSILSFILQHSARACPIQVLLSRYEQILRTSYSYAFFMFSKLPSCIHNSIYAR